MYKFVYVHRVAAPVLARGLQKLVDLVPRAVDPNYPAACAPVMAIIW